MKILVGKFSNLWKNISHSIQRDKAMILNYGNNFFNGSKTIFNYHCHIYANCKNLNKIIKYHPVNLYFPLGPLASFLIHKFGNKITTFVGGVLAFLGTLVSSLVPHPALIVVFFGAIGGE